MIRQIDLTREWSVSREYVSKLCKRGMPLDSLKAANEWREANAKSKTASTGVNAGKPVKAAEVPKGKRGRPMGSINGDRSLEGALKAAVNAQLRVAKMLDDAVMSNRPSLVAPMLSIHTKAIEARFSAEKAFREEQQKRNILIPLNDAIAMFRKGWDMVLGRLKRLPQSKCTACNPSNPRLAFDTLETAINQIVGDAQKEFAA